MTGSVDPAIPTYRSPFGGLWPDLNHAPFLIRGKFELGLITEEQVKQLEHWVEHGYLIIPNAVPGEVVDLVNSDVERAWRGELPSLRIEHWENNARHVVPIKPEIRDKPHKLLDIYSASEAARRAIFSQPIFDFLALVFERPPMAFQSLSFMRGMRGIGQPIHKDTAYVVVRSPMECAASWIALEDIQPNSGALEYYEGSHRGEEYLFNGKHKSMPEGYAEEERYLSSLHEQAREMGLPRKQFFPRKGDALIWSADLAHGEPPGAGVHRALRRPHRHGVLAALCTGAEPGGIHLGLLEAARVAERLSEGLLGAGRACPQIPASHAPQTALDYGLLEAVFSWP